MAKSSPSPARSKKKSRLELLLDAVTASTGLPTCVYDLEWFTKDDEKVSLTWTRREHNSAYCCYVKSSPEGWKRCIRDEYVRAAKANEAGGCHIHTCHAGLTDMVVPIHRRRKQVGAIYLGQVLTLSPADARKAVARTARAFGLDRRKLAALLEEQPKMTRAQLRRHFELVDTVREYVEMLEAQLPFAPDLDLETPLPSSAPIEIRKVPIYFLDQLTPETEPIKKALNLIRQSYWKKPSLESVARQVGFSASHFTREFQRETGMSYRTCMLKARLNAALYLLKRTYLNIAQIAELVGYEDASSMSRAFRKYTGAHCKQITRMQSPDHLTSSSGVY